MNNKSPDLGKRNEFSVGPVLMSGEQDVPVKEKGTARRKLALQDEPSDGENAEENDVVVKLPPPPPLTGYEKERIFNMKENEEVCRSLGVQSLVSSPRHHAVQNNKGKDKKRKAKLWRNVTHNIFQKTSAKMKVIGHWR